MTREPTDNELHEVPEDGDASDFNDSLLRGVARTPEDHQARAQWEARLPRTHDVLDGQYLILERHAEGGMGVIFRALDERVARPRAVKLPRFFPPAVQARCLELFHKEARFTAQFDHPGIIRVHHLGQHNELPYMVLDFLEGQDLAARLSQGPMDPREVLEVMLQVAAALVHVHAHHQGLFHRDLSPENIYIRNDRSVKVLDFGLVELAHQRRDLLEQPAGEDPSQQGMGKPLYMAPEQWEQDHDHRVDIWAMGVILYQALCSRLPYQRDQLGQGVAEPPPPPPIRELCPRAPKSLEAIVTRAMAWRADERYQTMGELQTALDRVLSELQGDPLPDGEPYRFLEVFEEEHAGWFFGRDNDTSRLLRMLREHPMVAVLGPSGAGKSSLVRAGLVPRLRRDRTDTWDVLVMSPGRDPLERLSHLVAQFCGERVSAGVTAETLRHRPGRLASVLHEHVRSTGRRVVLFVDQLEELYTLVTDEQTQRAVERALYGAAHTAAGPTRVVVAMRFEFIQQVRDREGFRRLLVANQQLVDPMDRDGMMAALERPAERRGYRFDHGLPGKVMDQLEGQEAPLPLLQAAATLLWERRDPERKTVPLDALASLGELPKVLSQHADSVLDAMEDPEDATAAWEIICSLVTTQRTRRRLPPAELLESLPASCGASAPAVLDRLLDSRLLSSVGGDVMLAHESLIQRWGRLRTWLAEDEELRQRLDWVRDAASRWKSGLGNLWQEKQLRALEPWEGRLGDRLGRQALDFVERSRQRVAQVRKRRRIMMVSALLIAAVVAVVSVLVAVEFRAKEKRASSNKRRAEASEKKARAETDRTILAQARLALETNPTLALAWLRKLSRNADGWAAWTMYAEALRRGTYRILSDYSVDEPPGVLMKSLARAADLSPSGRLLAYSTKGQQDGKLTIKVYDIGQRRTIRQFSAPRPDPPLLLSWSPTGRTIALGYNKDPRALSDWEDIVSKKGRQKRHPAPSLYLWDMQSQAFLNGPIKKVVDPVTALSFSADGKRLAVLSPERVRMVGGLTGAVLSDVEIPGVRRCNSDGRGGHHQCKPSGVALSPSGKYMALGTSEFNSSPVARYKHSITINRIGAPGRAQKLVTGPGYLIDLSFSRDGKSLAAVTSKAVTAWRPEQSSAPVMHWPHQAGGAVRAVAFWRGWLLHSQGDRSIRIASGDRNRRNLAELPRSSEPPEFVLAAHSLIVTGTPLGRLHIWNLPAPFRKGDLYQSSIPAGEIGGLVVSSDGGYLAYDEYRDLPGLPPSRGHVLHGGSLQPRCRALGGWKVLSGSPHFSPDGRFVVKKYEGALRFWSIKDCKQVGAPLVLNSDKGPIGAFAFFPDGRRIVSSGQNHSLRIWDVKSRTLASVINHDTSGQYDMINNLVIAPDGRHVVAGTLGEVLVYSTRKQRLIRSIPTLRSTYHQMQVSYKLAFSRDGKVLASSSGKTVQLVSTLTWKAFTRLDHEQPVAAIAFHPNSKVLATTSGGKGRVEVRFWSAADGSPLGTSIRKQWPGGVTFAPDGKHMYTVEKDHIRKWSLADANIPAIQRRVDELTNVHVGDDGTMVAR